MNSLSLPTGSPALQLEQLLLPTTSKSLLMLAGLAVLVCGCLVLDIALGSVPIPLLDVVRIVLGQPVDNVAYTTIVENVRIPKAVTAVLVGSALSVGGLQMQTLFRNPLAGPAELGITAGASFAVAVLMLTGGGILGSASLRQLGLGGSSLIITASCAGSALVMLLIMTISLRIRDNIALLVIGFLLSSVILAFVAIWQYFSSPEALQDFIVWTFGSLSGVSNAQLGLLAPVIVCALLASFATSKSLNLLLLGENYAASMGVNLTLAKLCIIATTSVLAGAITGFCGPIGLVGIAVPHLCRGLFNTSDHRLLIPGCCLLGAAILLLCDVVAQLPGTQTVLPINPVTSLLGAPVVIWVICQRNNLRQGF